MALFDRTSSTAIDVKLPASQEPPGWAEIAFGVFVGLWLFVVTLWFATALIFRAALEGINLGS